MNREILFRGKRADNGEWIYGYYFYDDFYKKAYITVGNYCIQLDREYPNKKILTAFEVIPETVGQYTGLTDKNSKKIFKGDILILRFTPCVVEWDTDNACYALYQNGITKVSGFNADTMKLFEVIGNIHDNPELLEVSE